MPARKPLPPTFDFKHIAHPTRKQQAKLASLPRKLLRVILADIEHPRDQVALMLTCKRIARRTSRVKLNEKLTSVYIDGRECRRLPYAQKDLLGALRKWRFIKPELQLCNCCVKYLPLNRIWKTTDGRAIRELPYVDWMWAISQWQRGIASCPTCQIESGIDESEWLQAWPEGYARGALIRQKTPLEV